MWLKPHKANLVLAMADSFQDENLLILREYLQIYIILCAIY